MSGNNCKVGRSFLTQEKIPDLRSKTVAMQKDHEENKSGSTESKTGNLHITITNVSCFHVSDIYFEL